MTEKDTIFSSKVKYTGLFPFPEFYRFCYDWLVDETDLDLAETKYVEKLAGNSKNIDIEWVGKRKVTDYFRFSVKVTYRILGLKKVEVERSGVKMQTNEGSVELKVSGTLERDYEGKFEKSAFNKFLRSIYEKWVIKSRIDQFEEKLIKDCDEFLKQAKAYMDLEGKR